MLGYWWGGHVTIFKYIKGCCKEVWNCPFQHLCLVKVFFAVLQWKKQAISFVPPTQHQCSLLFLCRCMTLPFLNCILILKNCFSNLSRQLWILMSTNILVIPARLALFANFVCILFISSSKWEHWIIWESGQTLWKWCLIKWSLISRTNTKASHTVQKFF